MQDLIRELGSDRITVFTCIVWMIVAIALSIGAGAFAGLRLGGKDLGSGLAASMGALYGPLAAVPGIFLGLMILSFV
jgi:hypothetical protein